jgi:hypothetical protein
MPTLPQLSEEAQTRVGGQTQAWDEISPQVQHPRLSLSRDLLLARVQELERWQDEANETIGLLSSNLMTLQAEVEKLQLVTTDLLKDRSQGLRPQATSSKPRRPPAPPSEDPSSDHGSVRSLSPSRADSALNLEEGENDEEWAAVHLPKKVKVDALPKLGGKDKEGLPYPKWKVDAKAQLDAVPGVSWLFALSPPSQTAPAEVRSWYGMVDKAVYAQLLAATREVGVVGDKVRRYAGQSACSIKVWKMLKDHYFRVADTNALLLQGELQQLAPREKESMELFLNRVQLLVEKYHDYGLQVPEKDLVTKVFSNLSITWWNAVGKSGVGDTLDWDEVKEKLLKEDTRRRQANANSEDSHLPLGWTRRGGQAKVSQGTGESSDPQNAQAHFAGGKDNKGKKPYEGNNKAKGEEKPGQDRPKKAVVCFFDLKVGHSWQECRSKPEGWQPSDEDVKKAMDKKRELDKKAAGNKGSGPPPRSGNSGSAHASHGTSHPPSTSAGPSGSGGAPSSHITEGRVTLLDI